MAYSVKTMLYLADLYFTDGKDNFRFQWTTRAFVDKLSKPSYEDDNEYFQALAKYNYAEKHLNDGSDKAASFRVTIYDKESGNVVKTQTVTATEAEFKLDNGEYLWDVAALDANGKVITTSEKSFFYNPDFEDYDDEDATISYRDSSEKHQIADIESCYATVNQFMYARMSQIGKIITGNKEAYFSVCGPSNCGNDQAWELTQQGGYFFSVSNAFGDFSGEFKLTGDCLITCGGIYEYESGKWNYKLFTDPYLDSSSDRGTSNYMFIEDKKEIYSWDTEQDKLVSCHTAGKEIYCISDHYYVTADGVFSINSGKQVLKYSVKNGEHLIFNDTFLNVVCRNSSGKEVDVLGAGKQGSVVAKYWFFDSKTGEITAKEAVIWEGKTDITLDSEEIFNTRIGNCFCFNLTDESDDYEMDPDGFAVVHEITADGTVKKKEAKVSSYEEPSFFTDNKGTLYHSYSPANGGDGQDFSFGIQVDLTVRETADITMLGGSSGGETPDNPKPDTPAEIVDDKNNWTDMKTEGADGDVEKLSSAITKPGKVISSKVGKDDEYDYYQFTLNYAAKLQFDITADDAAKFTIYSLNSKTAKDATTYSLKSLQSTTLNKAKGETDYTALTKELLLEKGTYYISMQSTNAKKGGDADYSITVNQNSVFYDKGDNGYDSWLYEKKENKVNADIKSIGTLAKGMTVSDNNSWVGFGDEYDYKAFTLDSAAKLQFDLTADDAAKFTIYSLVPKTTKGVTTYTVKSLQSTTLKKAKGETDYTALTKELLLEQGTYYISMQSTNAKKGGDAGYSISVDNNSVFYDRGDDGFDNVLYDKNSKEFYRENISYAGEINSDFGIYINDMYSVNCWVGFGDEWDHYKFSVQDSMNIAFNVSSSDDIKFMIYQIDNGKLKTLQTTTVKAGNSVDTKALALTSQGEYYIGVQSTNAKKGGNATYTISGSGYTKPVEMTLLGVKESTFEDWEEQFDDKYGDRYDSQTEYNYYIGEFKNAKQYNEDIEGTDGRDVIKCASGMVSWVDGNIRLGDGNDEINLAAHSYQTKLEVYRKGGSEYGMIDMGSGNDTIVLNKYADLEVREIDFGEGNDKLEIKANADGIEECTLINFGDGDDVMTVAGVSEELCVGMIDMGWGNDTLELKSLTGFSRIGSISMGDGDDTVKVDDVTLHSQEGWLGILDMGEGFDTLEMNGTLCLDSVSGVDKVTGSGTLVFGMSQPDEATAKLFKDAGIDMVCAGIGFTTREKELSDNTKANAVALDLDHDMTHIWLEGEENALWKGESGFADSVDWVKIDTSKLDDDESITIFSAYGWGATCTMYAPDGEETRIMSAAGSGYFELDDWERGTYYFKFEVDKMSSCSIGIAIDD